MSKGYNEKVTLEQELSFLNDYIILEKMKYIEMFDVVTDVDEKLLGAKIIKLSLQPLVENAIFSGIEPSGRFGEISVNAYSADDKLFISITDNGIGISEGQIGEYIMHNFISLISQITY